jgi:plastocyanin
MATSISQVRRWSALVALLALVSLTLAACGGGSSGNSSTTSSSAGSSSGGSASTTQSQPQPSDTTSSSSESGTTLTIDATERGGLGFSKRTLTARAGTVTIRAMNGKENRLTHAIAIEGNGVDKGGEYSQPNGWSTVTVRLKPGRYTFYCPVDGHEDAGMKGTLTVS